MIRARTRTVVIASVTAGLLLCGGLLWLIYLRTPSETGFGGLAWLSGFNAACNASSAACALAGFVAIRKRKVSIHMRLMLAALGFSTLFLVGYLTHHSLHGDTRFLGTGSVRTVYLTILASHIGLSFLAVPMLLCTVWFAASRRFSQHRRIALLTLPVWMYVSVTGVLVYVFLRGHS